MDIWARQVCFEHFDFLVLAVSNLNKCHNELITSLIRSVDVTVDVDCIKQLFMYTTLWKRKIQLDLDVWSSGQQRWWRIHIHNPSNPVKIMAILPDCIFQWFGQWDEPMRSNIGISFISKQKYWIMSYESMIICVFLISDWLI